MRVAWSLTERCRRLGNQVAYQSGSQKVSYSQLHDQVVLLTQYLDHWFKGAEKIACYKLEPHEYSLVFLATLASGRVFVPLNHFQAPGLLSEQIEELGIDLVIGEENPGLIQPQKFLSRSVLFLSVVPRRWWTPNEYSRSCAWTATTSCRATRMQTSWW